MDGILNQPESEHASKLHTDIWLSTEKRNYESKTEINGNFQKLKTQKLEEAKNVVCAWNFQSLKERSNSDYINEWIL